MGIGKLIWSDEFRGTKKKHKVIHVNEKTGEALIEETDTVGTTVLRVAATAGYLVLLVGVLSFLGGKSGK